MRFGGLVAINDLSFTAERGQITALIGPNGAGKTTVFNCITGFYKPTEGRIALQFGDRDDLERARNPHPARRAQPRAPRRLAVPARAHARLHVVAQKARVARTFQNIRLFPGMTVLENLLVAQHAPLMRASGWTVLGLLGLPSYARAERAAIEKARDMARSHRPDRPRRRPGRRPALWRAARARDRARHVHRPGAAVPRRARRRPQPERKRRARALPAARSATSTRPRSC